MKQSTKLLSLILALVMAFSFVSVIGSAIPGDVTRDNLTYDAIDDAILTSEQAATVILDYLDAQVMPGLGVIDLSVLGKLDLTSIDNALASVYDLLDSTAVGGLAISVPDVKALKNGGAELKGVKRSGGDLNVVYALLNFLGHKDVIGVLKKVPKGLLTKDGINLDWANDIVAGLVDLDDINGILTNIPGFATNAVFDLLVFGSFGYDKNAEDLGNKLPAEVDTIDEILTQAIVGLLMNPQDYHFEGKGENAVKVWDMDSVVFPSIAKNKDYTADFVRKYFSIADGANSIFALIDKLAPFAVYDLGINPLNNNLKKALMEACEADVNKIELEEVPADAQAAFEVGAVDADGNLIPAGKESYVTYISYDKIFHSDNDKWYYTTLETETVRDGNGDPVLDDDGNEKTQKVRKYFKVNMAAANEFATLVNWDWDLFAPVPRSKDYSDDIFYTLEPNEIDYTAIINHYGSIAQSLNHLLYIVFDNALTDEAKAHFEVETGAAWLDGATSDLVEGTEQTVFVNNIERLLKYLLANYADKIFGSDSEYVDWEYSDVEDMTIVELIAHIGPTFFEDVMPQLIMPKNDEGRAAFHEGVQVLEFGALVIREFMTEIAPQVNYDGVIFAKGSLTSAEGRQFAEHKASEWVNIILNMGVDIGITYLTNITNFNDFCKVEFEDPKYDIAQWAMDNDGTSNPDAAVKADHWNFVLDTAILWAVNYVGTADKKESVLNGINYTTVKAVSGPLNKLSFILNEILPLGFVNGCTSETYDLDVQLLLDRIIELATNFNLDAIVGLFGRNADAKYNLFTTAPLVQGVLDLVNRILALVFRKNILPETSSCAALLTNDNLSKVIENLIGNLKNIDDKLLPAALPAVCKLIKMFGGEQDFGTPDITIDETMLSDNGSVSTEFNIINTSEGLWRGYKDASGNQFKDQQYSYKIVSVKAYNTDGSSTTLSPNKTDVNYGDKATVAYSASAPATGLLQRIEVKYTVKDEDGAVMADGKTFTSNKYVWVGFSGTNEGDSYDTENQGPKDCRVQIGKLNYYFDINEVDPVEAINGIQLIHLTKDDSLKNYTVGVKATGKATHSSIYLEAQMYTNKDKVDAYKTYKITDEAAFRKFAANCGSKISYDIECFANSKSNSRATVNSTIVFYDSVALGKVKDLAEAEAGAMRLPEYYDTTSAHVYADKLLRTEDWDEERPQQTNSTATAWIDALENEYADAQVTKDEPVVDEATGKVVSQTGTVTVDGRKVAVKKVTKLTNLQEIWNRYAAALPVAIRASRQELRNANAVYGFPTIYKNLYIASTEVEYLKKDATEITGDNIVKAIEELEKNVKAIEAQYSNDKDYTDYRMYRWNRYNDARNDAWDIINAYKATLRTSDDLNKYFPYTSIYPSEVAKLVAGDKYEDYINALLENNSSDVVARNEADLVNAKRHFNGYNSIDVAQADNLVARMAPRLLTRTHGVIDTHLANEVASAKAMITDESLYTERSWAIYADALADAEAILAGNGKTQMTVFDAKWALLCARNGLVYVEDEANYDELKALIAQAQTALANTDLYNNTDKEFGQVLAELGYDEFDGRQLFPDSALIVERRAYSVDDQDEIDDAADALKEALARLKFKGLNITGDAAVSEGIMSADDPNTKEVEKTITATIATIAAEMDADAVKDLFKVTAKDITVGKDNITVSNDLYYTVDTDLPGFAGTNSVVTFYTVEGDIKIPVATVKIVVEADVTGDGVIDVLDATYEHLALIDKAELDGCYLLAGDLSGADRIITGDDYSAVVNKVCA